MTSRGTPGPSGCPPSTLRGGEPAGDAFAQACEGFQETIVLLRRTDGQAHEGALQAVRLHGAQEPPVRLEAVHHLFCRDAQSADVEEDEVALGRMWSHERIGFERTLHAP